MSPLELQWQVCARWSVKNMRLNEDDHQLIDSSFATTQLIIEWKTNFSSLSSLSNSHTRTHRCLLTLTHTHPLAPTHTHTHTYTLTHTHARTERESNAFKWKRHSLLDKEFPTQRGKSEKDQNHETETNQDWFWSRNLKHLVLRPWWWSCA